MNKRDDICEMDNPGGLVCDDVAASCMHKRTWLSCFSSQYWTHLLWRSLFILNGSLIVALANTEWVSESVTSGDNQWSLVEQRRHSALKHQCYTATCQLIRFLRETKHFKSKTWKGLALVLEFDSCCCWREIRNSSWLCFCFFTLNVNSRRPQSAGCGPLKPRGCFAIFNFLIQVCIHCSFTHHPSSLVSGSLKLQGERVSGSCRRKGCVWWINCSVGPALAICLTHWAPPLCSPAPHRQLSLPGPTTCL